MLEQAHNYFAHAVAQVSVQAPAGPYAVVAAGCFKPDGESEGIPYNGLTAEKIGVGQYLLRFDMCDDWYHDGLTKAGEVTLIVKGTVVDPLLPAFLDSVEEEPYSNPDFPSMTPATFQVVELAEEGILIWITQPLLRYDLFTALAREEIDLEDNRNVILFTPVDKAFMVEISAYGPALTGYFSGDSERVNINTASVEELRSLPRIGPALAGRIVQLRNEIGGFTSFDQLKDVQGIDEFLVSRLRHLMRL